MGKVIKYRIVFDGTFYSVEKLIKWRFCFGLIRTWHKCWFRLSNGGFRVNVSRLSTIELAIKAMKNEIENTNAQCYPKKIREVFV